MSINENMYNDIISSQNLNDNKFILFLKENTNLNKDYKVPKINIIIKYYILHFYELLFKNNSNKLTFLIFRLYQIFSILFVILGIVLPMKYIKYHILFCIKLLILSDLFNEYYVTKILKKLTNKNVKTIPIDNKFVNNSILFFLIISLFNIIIPDYSLFKYLQKFTNYFN